MKKNNNDRVSRFFNGGGFYIALLLCIVAVGVGIWAATGSKVPASVRPTEAAGAFNPKTPMVTAAPTAKPSAKPTATPAATPAATPSATPAVPDVAPLVYIWPLSGELKLDYSVDALLYDAVQGDWRTHAGLDIAAEAGAPVSAVSDGVVESVERGGALGVTVTLYHGGGVRSVYANLDENVPVAAGDAVSAGETLGLVGTTAVAEGAQAHLHFAMSLNGVRADPRDYLPE